MFCNRKEAGQRLAKKLRQYADNPEAIVLALPRGGVPVGFWVASLLNLPLDTFIVRKIGVPGHEELAMGAIASGGVVVRNHAVVSQLGITESVFDHVVKEENIELERREKLYRGNRQLLSFKDKVCLVVDDGIATGASMQAAIAAIRLHKPKEVVIATPVVSADVASVLSGLADRVVCAEMPRDLIAVGAWYEDFSQIQDDEVRVLLDKATKHLTI